MVAAFAAAKAVYGSGLARGILNPNLRYNICRFFAAVRAQVFGNAKRCGVQNR